MERVEDDRPYEEMKIPEGIHSQAEDTFGNAETLHRQFAETQSKLMKEKESLQEAVEMLSDQLDQSRQHINDLEAQMNDIQVR